MPSGCAFQLDSVAREQVLRSLQQHLARRQRVIEEAKEIAAGSGKPLTLASFIDATGREPEDVYAAGGWTTVRRAAGLLEERENETEDTTSERLGRLLHVDEPTRLASWLRISETPVLTVSDVEQTRRTMLSIQLEPRGIVPSHEALASRLSSPNIKRELQELCEVLADRVPLPEDVFPEREWPLALHRHYSRFEIAAAVGYKRPGDKAGVPQAGILKVSGKRELLFVTLDKSNKSFSPTTRYRDYAISNQLFHWETQSVASVSSESGKRYLESPKNGWRFFLFVRTNPDAPFAFCGPATYQSHEGDRPIAITWRLQHTLPANLYQSYATLEQG